MELLKKSPENVELEVTALQSFSWSVMRKVEKGYIIDTGFKNLLPVSSTIVWANEIYKTVYSADTTGAWKIITKPVWV